MTAPPRIVDAAEMGRRVIEPAEFVPDTGAFIDVRLPRSSGKASYSLIGPGVSQNSGQSINLTEPHGFCVGAASMPHGTVNNPHLHYTAEVFICTRSRWRMTIGQRGEQTLEIGPGTVFSAPTWVFRGFENIGGDDGWLFTVLGGDDTGGIIWAPDVLRQAAETGLYLASDHTVMERTNDQCVADAIVPLDDEEFESVDSYTTSQLRSRAVGLDSLDWSRRSLLSSVLTGHASAVAPVIGFGMSEDRRHSPAIWNPHGFSIEWLSVPAGSRVGLHRLDGSQVLLLNQGDWEVRFNRGDAVASTRPPPEAVVSVPAGAWRDFANVGAGDATALVVCGGDARARIEWDPAIVHSARAAGWARDAGGYLAPLRLLAGSVPATDADFSGTHMVNSNEHLPRREN